MAIQPVHHVNQVDIHQSMIVPVVMVVQFELIHYLILLTASHNVQHVLLVHMVLLHIVLPVNHVYLVSDFHVLMLTNQ
jgi:hypothetical protein